MARISRILITGEKTVYHVMSRTTLPGYPLEDVEKDFFVERVKKLGMLYFVEIFGFCCITLSLARSHARIRILAMRMCKSD